MESIDTVTNTISPDYHRFSDIANKFYPLMRSLSSSGTPSYDSLLDSLVKTIGQLEKQTGTLSELPPERNKQARIYLGRSLIQYTTIRKHLQSNQSTQ